MNKHIWMPSGKVPITGTFTGSGQQSLSFAPLPGRGFNVSLDGAGTGQFQLVRQLPGDTIWRPLTVNGVQLYLWTVANASEQVEEDESNTLYALQCVLNPVGTVNYRISQ
jgi:hypothetical protein